MTYFGKQMHCTEVVCYSNNYTLTNCTVEELQTISSVVLIHETRVSYESCTPHHSPSGAKYGFYYTYMWVDNGCRAIFNVCGGTAAMFKCAIVKCYSQDYHLSNCTIEEIESITNVSVNKRKSKSVCYFHDGPPGTYASIVRGSYGFNDNYVWVDKGCQANFSVCGAYRVSASTVFIEPTTTTRVPISTSRSSILTGQQLTTECTVQTVTSVLTTKTFSQPSLTTLKDVSIPSTTLTNNAFKRGAQNTNAFGLATMTGVAFGSVAGLAVLGGATYFLYKRVSRNRVTPENIVE